MHNGGISKRRTEMRKELEYRKADKDKIKRAKDLIEQIAGPGADEKTVEAALNELGELTGRQHEQSEFVEYWGWTDLDSIAEQAFAQPPYASDLTREELIEIIAIMKRAIVNCEDSEMMHYEGILHRSLPLADVLGYIDINKDNAQIADEMLAAAKSGVIML